MKEINYPDILSLKNKELQQMKDERDEMLELLLDIVNEPSFSEQQLHIQHAHDYLEQLKKKR
jgi:hypothetical protein